MSELNLVSSKIPKNKIYFINVKKKVVKTRILVQGTEISNERYSGIMDGLITILKKEGVAPLYGGLSSEYLTAIVKNFIFYLYYETMKKRVKVNSPLNDLLNGVTGACIVNLCTTPLQVIQTQIKISHLQGEQPPFLRVAVFVTGHANCFFLPKLFYLQKKKQEALLWDFSRHLRGKFAPTEFLVSIRD